MQGVVVELHHRELFEAQLHGARTDAAGAPSGKQGRQRLRVGMHFEPTLQCLPAVAPEWRLTGFVAFTGDADKSGLQIDACDVECNQFSKAQSGAVEQFQHRPVAHLPGRGRICLEKSGGLIGIEGFGQRIARFGCAHHRGWVAGQPSVLLQIAEKAAQR